MEKNYEAMETDELSNEMAELQKSQKIMINRLHDLESEKFGYEKELCVLQEQMAEINVGKKKIELKINEIKPSLSKGKLLIKENTLNLSMLEKLYWRKKNG